MQNRNPPSSWLGRNWKWAVPLGCLTSVAGVVAFAAGIVVVVFGFIKRSDVFEYAVAKARSSPSVIESLGEPIEPGWYLSGSINVNGPSGNADIAVPLSGPRGKGTLFAVAIQKAGKWEYEVLEVELEVGGERIDLRDD